MSDLVEIPVPGSSVPMMATNVDGRPMVALRPMCEALGLDYSSQLAKLKTKSWATMGMITTVGADGKNREMVCIDRRTVGMWLATIDEGRVSDAARPNVIALQAEAADVLDAYFSRGLAVQTAPVNQYDVLRAAIDQIEAAEREAKEAKAIALRTAARVDAIEGQHGWYSALAYSKIHGLDTSLEATNQLGRRASAAAKAEGIQPHKVRSDRFGTVNSYPERIWDQVAA